MSDIGLRIWDAAGVLVLDETQRIGRDKGVVTTTANVSGSVSIARNSGEHVFYAQLPKTATGGAFQGPTLSFDTATNVLSWTASPTPSTILYGVY